MSSQKSGIFYGLLIALSSLVVGMVLASRLGLAPAGFADPLNVPAANSAPLDGPIDASTFRTIANAASPGVVSIRTVSMRRAAQLEDFFGFPNPFRNQPSPDRRGETPQTPVEGAGSGFIIDKNGHILTNNHVVEGATRITVLLAGMDNFDEGLPATVVGSDLLTDTALLKLDKLPDEPLTVTRFGDSAQLGPGDWVMAIGNPFGLSNTVTVGVVSAVGRLQQTAVSQRFEEMIQTDAAINRGNSGGPLLNVRGEVVGINTQILSDQAGGNIGIGFAVPINSIREILPQLQKGKVVRGRIGVTVSRIPLTRQDAQDLGLSSVTGAMVTEVGEGPARKAGIRVGDIILEFNGRAVNSSDELVAMVTRTAPGTTIPVKVLRARKTLTLNVTIEELDVEAEQAQVVRAQPELMPEGPTDTGYGMTIEGVPTALARRLNVPSGRGGAIVSNVEPGSAAAQAGVQRGDVILDINDRPMTSVDEVSKALDAVGSGRTARIIVFRGGREVLLQVRKR